jgi:GNAT superfamily N-acetyltransferase
MVEFRMASRLRQIDTTIPKLRITPVKPELWPAIEKLFGDRGACGGCWCMTFRRRRAEYVANQGAGNRRALKRLISSGEPVGVLALSGDEAVGWCSVAPKSQFPVLLHSRNFAGLQSPRVWSVTCFYIAKPFRRRGVSLALLEGAVRLAKRHGAEVVEGYPHEPIKDMPPPFVWTGIADVFRKAGFEEVQRKSAQRPLMRKKLR